VSADTATIQKWFDAHVDDDEILAVVSVSTAEEELPDDDDDKEIAIKRIARRFRSGTRQSRMSVAEEAQELFERKISWGIQAGEDTYLFTHVTAPAMTRLRIAERRVLDTLVNAGVANSHSEALSWCVSFVSKNEKAWLSDLRDAFKTVEKMRRDGPKGKES
jgi:hypothetical protein